MKDFNCKFLKWEDDVEKLGNEIDKHEHLEVEIEVLPDKIQKMKQRKKTMKQHFDCVLMVHLVCDCISS